MQHISQTPSITIQQTTSRDPQVDLLRQEEEEEEEEDGIFSDHNNFPQKTSSFLMELFKRRERARVNCILDNENAF
jgi:hypothetical protein